MLERSIWISFHFDDVSPRLGSGLDPQGLLPRILGFFPKNSFHPEAWNFFVGNSNELRLNLHLPLLRGGVASMPHPSEFQQKCF